MRETLKKHFGYDNFKPLQEEIIRDILDKRDVLVLMPTGGGKSLCYQLPAVMMNGLTMVISPLISLMKDQVDDLLSAGIPAASINSTLDYGRVAEIKSKLLSKHIKLLYVAPERIVLPNFYDFLRQLEVDLIAIDEAHCISEWGHDFRPEYRKLNLLKESFPNIPIIALTSTAVKQVQGDIVTQLKMKEPRIYRASLNRKNLFYEIRPKKDVYREVLRYIKKRQNDSGIIYCQSRKSVEQMAERLKRDGVRALPYHAGLAPIVRNDNQTKFINDDVDVIVGTIAFGMGIDKPNVRYVIHCDMPKSIEGYYQETGRAGRDGLKSECILFFSFADKIKQEYFINQIENEEYRRIATRKMWDMINYCRDERCRRIKLLRYFGENYYDSNCGMCDVCVPKDKTEEKLQTEKMDEVIKTSKSAIFNHAIFDKELFEILRRLRKEIADKESLPPYMIFSDVSLKDMAIKMPQGYESFMQINGVGEVKLRKYGDVFLDEIKSYCKDNATKENKDSTEDLRKSIIEVIKLFTNGEVSATNIARILTGLDGSKKIKEFNLLYNPLFGKYKYLTRKEVMRVIREMLASGEIEIISRTESDTGRRKIDISGQGNNLSKTYSMVEVRKNHPNAYNKWTEEEERLLISEFRSGKSYKNIADLLGRRTGGIVARLEKLGLIEYEDKLKIQ